MQEKRAAPPPPPPPTSPPPRQRYDVTFFKVTKKLSDGTFAQTHLSNWEVRQTQMVKGEYGLPYLYNHFEFAHCEAVEGITFQAVEDASEEVGGGKRGRRRRRG